MGTPSRWPKQRLSAKRQKQCGSRKGPCDIWDEGMITVLGAMGHSADRQASVAVPDLLSDAQVAGSGARLSPPDTPAKSADRTLADSHLRPCISRPRAAGLCAY